MCGREATPFKTYDLPISVIRSFESIYPYVEEVTLHGWGEGTLHPKLFEILEFLNKYPSLRKYFVTNGSTLNKITKAIFDFHVDLVAISLDGASSETNNSIRKGGNFERQVTSLRKLISEKKMRGLNYPYINFVFTAMRRNIHELPDMVRLASDLGIPEVKVVYLTVFDESLLHESLLNSQDMVIKTFKEAEELANELQVNLKLPPIQGSSEAGNLRHESCALLWRDLYIGSDGFIRSCQSSAIKLAHVSEDHNFETLWNSKEMQELRSSVNIDNLMPKECYYCYHSSCANWNLNHSFNQIGLDFAPKWKVKDDEFVKQI